MGQKLNGRTSNTSGNLVNWHGYTEDKRVVDGYMTSLCAVSADMASQVTDLGLRGADLPNSGDDAARNSDSDSPARNEHHLDGDEGCAERENSECYARPALAYDVDDNDVGGPSVVTGSDDEDDSVFTVPRYAESVAPLSL